MSPRGLNTIPVSAVNFVAALDIWMSEGAMIGVIVPFGSAFEFD